jgi:hypothetical protein
MDPLIIFFIIILIIIITIALILILNQPHNTVVGTTGGVLLSSNSCNISAQSVPDLSFEPCCVTFGRLSNNKYLASLNMVVSPDIVPYLEVCSGFCIGGYDKNMNSCQIVEGVQDNGQNNFNLCYQNIAPINCNSLAKPVAISGTQFLFGNSATNLLCQTTAPCGIS